jgi:catalase
LKLLAEEIFTERFLFETQDIRSEFIAVNRNFFAKAAKEFPDFVYMVLTKKYKNLAHAEHVIFRIETPKSFLEFLLAVHCESS